MEKIVEEATGVLEAVADELWVPWAEQVIPNVVLQAREWVEAKVCEEHVKKVQEEVA